MPRVKSTFFNFWSFSVILIIFSSYYYIARVSFNGVPSLSAHYSALFGSGKSEESEEVPTIEDIKYEPKGPIVLSEHDFLLLNTEKCNYVRHRMAKKVSNLLGKSFKVRHKSCHCK